MILSYCIRQGFHIIMKLENFLYIHSLYKLETQKNQSCNSLWVQRLENQGSQWFKSQSKGQRRWGNMSPLNQAGGKRNGTKFFPCPCPLFYSSSQWIHWCPRQESQCPWLKSSIKMMISSGNMSQTRPDRTFDLGSPLPVKLTHILCPHTYYSIVMTYQSVLHILLN